MDKVKYIEKAVAALSVTEKPKLVAFIAHHQTFSLVPTREKFVVEAANTQRITTSGICYTLEELANNAYKRVIIKGQSPKGRTKNFGEEYSRKSTLL